MVIPWFDGGRLALVKVRQTRAARRPKYVGSLPRPAPASSVYPGPEAIRPGRPLVIVEGEFDALLLGQELSGLAAVVTLGSASARPDPGVLGGMLAAPVVRRDRRRPGRGQGRRRLARPARRVRPPGPFKDWTEARQAGWTWPAGGRTSWPATTAPAVHLGGAGRLAVGTGRR